MFDAVQRRCGLSLAGTLLLIATCVPPAFAEELQLDARRIHETSTSQHLQITADGEVIELTRGVLYDDDGPAAGYSYKPNVATLRPEVRLRKTLLIANPAAYRARLLVAPGGALEVTINGRPVTLRDKTKSGNYWEVADIDPAALRTGENQIVLAGSGKLWIARNDEYPEGTTSPNRSARSSDGGRTWVTDQLADADGVDGEYYVRLFLDQHTSEGSLRLPVIDLGNLAERPIAAPVSAIRSVKVRAATELNEAGKVRLRTRTGSTFVPDAEHWSAWKEWDTAATSLAEIRGRFLQVEVVLETSDPLRSPQLRSVSIAAEVERPADWTKSLNVHEWENAAVVRTSIPFRYEPFTHPELQRLRAEHNLDEVIAGAKSELEQLERLAAWSATRWPGLGHLKEIYPAWNAHEILAKHADGTCVGGFCQQFNIVFLQACESLGFVGRVVSIGPGDQTQKIRGGHETVEIWSNEFGKWIYFDGNTAWYAVDRESRIPLSLLELRERQLAAFAGEEFSSIEINTIAETRHEWKGLESWPPFMELRLIPRSNVLEQPSPLPLNQGMRGWFWTGHHVWSDDRLPDRPLYAQRVRRRGDFEWSLNRGHLMLEPTATSGAFRVHVDAEVPHLAKWLAAIDERVGQTVEPIFTWRLHRGRNVLEVVPENTAGRRLIPSRIVLDWSDESPN